MLSSVTKRQLVTTGMVECKTFISRNDIFGKKEFVDKRRGRSIDIRFKIEHMHHCDLIKKR